MTDALPSEAAPAGAVIRISRQSQAMCLGLGLAIAVFGAALSDRVIGALGILPIAVTLWLRFRPAGQLEESAMRFGGEAIPFEAVYRVQWLCSVLLLLEYRTEAGQFESRLIEADLPILDRIAGLSRKAGARVLERGRKRLFPSQPAAVAAGLFLATICVFFIATALIR